MGDRYFFFFLRNNLSQINYFRFRRPCILNIYYLMYVLVRLILDTTTYLYNEETLKESVPLGAIYWWNLRTNVHRHKRTKGPRLTLLSSLLCTFINRNFVLNLCNPYLNSSSYRGLIYVCFCLLPLPFYM